MIDFMSNFDWIGPLFGWISGFINGPNYTFFIPMSGQYSGRGIVRALRKRKVKVVAGLVVDDTINIDVKMKQAVRAQILLKTWGIPVYNPLPLKRKRRKRGRV